jgi:ferredoxin
VGDDGIARFVDENANDAQGSVVEEAVAKCPTGAITLED